MIRAVLDTNIFLRALINPKSKSGRFFFEFSHLYTLVLSPEIIRELLEVLHRPVIRESFPQVSDIAVERILEAFAKAEVIETKLEVKVSRDPKDNKFIACALAGRCQYLISEDKDLTSIGEYKGIRIITSQEFLEILESL
jgi:hypothetical protein